MSDDEGQHPNVDVSFAPTEPFVRRWGESVAAEQARKYNSPTWQVQVPMPPTSSTTPLAEADDRMDIVFLGTGIIIGVLLSFSIYLLFKPHDG